MCWVGEDWKKARFEGKNLECHFGCVGSEIPSKTNDGFEGKIQESTAYRLPLKPWGWMRLHTCACVLSLVWLLWPHGLYVAQQIPSMGFSREEYWCELPFPHIEETKRLGLSCGVSQHTKVRKKKKKNIAKDKGTRQTGRRETKLMVQKPREIVFHEEKTVSLAAEDIE